MTDNQTRVGAAIRNRRRHLNMTLADLAQKCGLSKPFLSQLENNKASPSLTSLMKVAEALDVDMGHFVSVPASQDFVRRATAPVVLDLGLPVQYEKLTADHEGSALDASIVHIPAGEGHPFTQREGEGLWYVLSGELEMTVGNEKFILETGDSAHIDQRHPHKAQASDKGAVRLLWCGTPKMINF